MSESLEVPIDGNPTGFRRAMQEVMQSAKDGASSVETSFGGLNRVFDGVRGHIAALGVAVSVGGFATLIKSSIDAADNLHDMSERTGMTVEVLAGLKLVADQSGTSLDGLGTGFKKLSVNLVDAAAGNKEMSSIFKGLGISGTDAQAAMYRLADIMKTLPDGAQKTALAIKLLGRSGEEMIPLLNQGGEALRKMIEHGQELSGVTSDMAVKADQFNDKMAELKTQTAAFGVNVATYTLPALNDIAAAMIRAQKEVGTLAALFVGLGVATAAAFGVAINPLDMASNKANKLFTELFSAKQKLNELQATKDGGGLAGFFIRDEDIERQKRYIADVSARLKEAVATRDSLMGTPPGEDKKPGPAVNVAKILGAGNETKDKPGPDSYMQHYEATLAQEKQLSSERDALREYTKNEELAFWRFLYDVADLTEKDRLAIARKVSDLTVAVRRKEALDIKAIAEDDASTQETLALGRVEAERTAAQIALDLGQITKAQFLAQEEQFEQQRFEIQRTALEGRLELLALDPLTNAVEYARLKNKILELEQQHGLKLIQSHGKIAQESGQIWTDLDGRMSGLWDQGTQAMLNGTLTWSNSMRAVGAQVVAWFATDVVGKTVKSWIFGETAKTGATQAGTVMRLALESGAALKSIGIGALAAIKKIMNAAAETFAGIFAFLSPEMGPYAAIPAAIGAGAVAAMTGKVMSASGGYDIPRGINPLTQLHEQEMVLPAKHANTIRDLADGGGNSGGGPNVTYNDYSGRLTAEEINRNAGLIVKALKGQIRNFAVLK
jgi:hypothetical protein